MNCDPSDTYCHNPSMEDRGIISFYSSNTGIPGPLVRSTPVWAKKQVVSKSGPAAMRSMFRQTQFLDYAHPDLRQMRGAAYMRGHTVEQYNVDTLPQDGTHNRGAFDMDTEVPMEFTPTWSRKEKCGCGDEPKPGSTTKPGY